MKRNKPRTGMFSGSLAGSVIVGIMCAMLISLLLGALLTNFLLKGYLGDNGAEGMVFAIRVISSLLGALAAGAMLRENYLKLVGLIAGGWFIVLTALGIIFYEGSFTNVISGAISVILGGGLALLIFCAAKGKSRKYPKIKI